MRHVVITCPRASILDGCSVARIRHTSLWIIDPTSPDASSRSSFDVISIITVDIALTAAGRPSTSSCTAVSRISLRAIRRSAKHLIADWTTAAAALAPALAPSRKRTSSTARARPGTIRATGGTDARREPTRRYATKRSVERRQLPAVAASMLHVSTRGELRDSSVMLRSCVCLGSHGILLRCEPRSPDDSGVRHWSIRHRAT